MSEYYDIKQNSYRVTESVVALEDRAEAEEELITELYRIFRGK